MPCVLFRGTLPLTPSFHEVLDAPEGVQDFWRIVDQAAVIEAAAEGIGPFLTLASANWFGKDKSLDRTMYVRQCYPEMWRSILERKDLGTSRFGILGKHNLAWS